MFIYKKAATGLNDIVKLEGTKHFTLYTVLYEIKLQAIDYTRCTCTPYTLYMYTIHIEHLHYTHCICTLYTFYM